MAKPKVSRRKKLDPLQTTFLAEALARRMAYGLPSLFKPSRAVRALALVIMQMHGPVS